VRTVESDGTLGATIGAWLRQQGAAWGRDVLYHRVSLYWPEDRRYYPGRLITFDASTGEHQIEVRAVPPRVAVLA
jgi:hypothetical protein